MFSLFMYILHLFICTCIYRCISVILFILYIIRKPKQNRWLMAHELRWCTTCANDLCLIEHVLFVLKLVLFSILTILNLILEASV